jgi:hypothetical protein
MGSKGLGPKDIESNNVYRVEEYVDGRVLTMLELRSTVIQRRLAQTLCDINYDEDLNRTIRSLRSRDHIQSIAFIED